MDVIDVIRKKVARYPQVRFGAGPRHIHIDPPFEQGFAVEVTVQPAYIEVAFDGWFERFDSEEEALACFDFAFSDRCRLRVDRAGRMDYRWTLECRYEDTWEKDTSVTNLVRPFWQPTKVRYLQNVPAGQRHTGAMF
jgi:hypothetical protein